MTSLDSIRGVDVYLVDQILKGRIPEHAQVLDVGCGGGRNLRWFEARGHRTVGVDRAPNSGARALAEGADLPFAPRSFDVVLSIAVLHFAQDDEHFVAMLDEMARVLRPGGLFFARFATTLGMEQQARPLARGWFALPDGSERYLVRPDAIHGWAAERGVSLLDPFKTTLVENQRSMATWVWRERE
ncbi:MAG: class I SAM-dependent methyltransferase [Planctomycetota bacterium]